MKSIKLLFLVLLVITLPPTISKVIANDSDHFSSLFNKKNIGHIVMIGFEDQQINRVQNISSPSSYRRRGDYYSSTWSKRISSQIEDQYSLRKLTEWPMSEIGVHCVVYLVPQNKSVKKTIEQLARDERVKIVQKMHIFNTKSHLYNDPYFRLQSNMQDMQIDLAHRITTGRDVKIALIDTGVDLGHPDLKDQIKINKNFVSGFSSSFSSDKHGTAVAGILVAKSNNKTGIIGVAPHARLFALKACWPNQTNSLISSCNSYTLALAVNSAIKLGAKVLNMSLTGPQDPLLEMLLNKAMEKGMIIIAADETESKNNNARFPASLKNVISVQSIYNPNTNKVNSKQSIVARGDNILTTVPHGTYDFISGSSLAAAQVSGIVALILELNPDITLVETKKILHDSILASSSNGINTREIAYGINANTAVMKVCDTQKCPHHL